MIYQPSPLVVDLRLSLLAGLIQALLHAAIDFIAEENKPWGYYVGLAVGHSAMATGIPGATATIYATGEVLDALILHSPEGSVVDVYQNGVLHSTIDTYNLADLWEVLQIELIHNITNEITFVNREPSPSNTAGFPWLALGTFTVSGDFARLAERAEGQMPIPNIISFSVEDSDGDSNSVPINVDAGLTLAQYTEFAQEFAPLMDAVIDGKITGIQLTLNIALPAGLKASPVAGCENQLRANFLFNTAARYRYGLSVPSWTPANFSGKAVDLEATGVGTFVNALTGGLDASGTQVIPRDGYGNDLVSMATAVKAHRRK